MAMSNFGFRAHQPKDVFEAVGAKGDRLCALLYVDTLPRLSTYTALADGLREAGHMPILLLRNELHGLGVEDAVGEQTGAFFIAPENIRTVLGADAYFSQEQAAGFAPPDVPTVAIMHSLPDFRLEERRSHPWRTPLAAALPDYGANGGLFRHRGPANRPTMERRSLQACRPPLSPAVPRSPKTCPRHRAGRLSEA